MPMNADDYLTNSESALSRADHRAEPDKAKLWISEAQVMALQGIAAAIDRLAAAVEGLQDR